MFDLVKKQVNLLSKLEKDLGVTFKQSGESNWKIEGDKTVESCPFCGHHDCFSVKLVTGGEESAFYKCFSCGKHGDVIAWEAERHSLTPVEAAKKLAKEAGIVLPNDYNPIQSIFTMAAEYYHNCLIDTCDKPQVALNGLTPTRYQTEVRKHKEATLTKFKVGYSDGRLVEFLEGMGVDRELIKSSGLMNSKNGKDYLPAGCFIYPHFCKGRASHFTFKDPLKRVQYQLPKKYSLNGYLFYGQDAFLKENVIYLVEGENDYLSMMEYEGCNSAVSIIGQLSSEQVEWLKAHARDKNIMTVFDPDDAGDKYRQKLEAVRKYFKGLIHVKPPEGKDIDEHLTSGANLVELIKANIIEVSLEDPKKPVVEDAIWKEVSKAAPASTLPRLPADAMPVESPPWETVQEPLGPSTAPGEGVDSLPAGQTIVGPSPTVVEPSDLASRIPATFSAQSSGQEVVAQDDLDVVEDGNILQKKGCYFKVKLNKEGIPEETRITNFTMKIVNIYEDENEDRFREVILVRQDGYKSKPFLVDSETKVTVKLFKIMAAKHGDCEWLGREPELDAVWRLVMNQYSDIVITVAPQVGRYEKESCWIFKNVLITGSGVAISPDVNGVFWPSTKTRGIKPDVITNGGSREDSIPELSLGKSREEAEGLLREGLQGFTQVLKDPGPALMAVGWIWSNVYSNEIFKYNGGMGSLMFWGTAGKGKSTLGKWLQRFWGFREKMASTSIQLLRGGIGFLRKAQYYASMPMFLDELRANEESNQYLGMIRSWYDREGRTMADINDPKKIRNQKIHATLMIAGEDLPADPATRERCIMVRVPRGDDDITPESQRNYDLMETISKEFSNITYFWIIDSCLEDKEAVLQEIRKLDVELVRSGCSNRISKVWGGAAYFAKKLAEKYYPEYDFMKYLIQAGTQEQTQQKNDNTLSSFFELVESLQGRVNSPITDGHVYRDASNPKLVHIWFPAVFKEVSDAERGKCFSKHAILRAIREEPYFVSDDRRIAMGLSGHRRAVLTLDLSKSPETVRNLVGYET